MTIRFIRIFDIPFVIGAVSAGYMGSSDPLSSTSAHARIHPLGWMSLALTDLTHRAFPQAGRSGLAAALCRLNMIGIPLPAMELFSPGKFGASVLPSAAVGLTVTYGIAFAANILKNLRPSG